MHPDEAAVIARYMSADQIEAVRRAMIEIYFPGLSSEYMLPPDFLDSPEGRAAVHQSTTLRFYECVGFIVPWIRRHCDLSNATVLEIGCGTGSSTAALALAAKRVLGFDIGEGSVKAATRRFEILGIKNAGAEALPAAGLMSAVRARFATATVDAVFLYAVIEHQTFDERIETLKTAWEMLRPGGVLIIADTPNRLTYTDRHTTWLPFFDMLPPEVAIAYADRSPRASFPVSIKNALAVSRTSAEEVLTRWGRGVSYHDFELALGDLNELVVGDGFDEEVRALKPPSFEEKLLYAYFKHNNLAVPPAFVRDSIDVILRKPGGERRESRARDLTDLMKL